VILAVDIIATADATVAQSAPECAPSYQSFRYDEDWSCLKDPDHRRELWDSVKYIGLGGDRYLSLGADARQGLGFCDAASGNRPRGVRRWTRAANTVGCVGWKRAGAASVWEPRGLPVGPACGEHPVRPGPRLGASHDARRPRMGVPESVGNYNIEPIVQWGQFESGRIRAWAIATDLGVSWLSLPLRPRLGLRADATSGDRDIENVSLETFNPLFAGIPYSGLAGLGPSNVWDVTPSLSVSDAHFALTGGCAVFSRTSLGDGIYGISLNLERTGRMSRALHVGVQPTLQLNWPPSRHLGVVATASFFTVGRFLIETPPGQNVFYTTAFAAYRF
jgi:Alginate export